MHAAAVGVNLNGFGEQAARDLFCQRSAETGSVNTVNDAVTDMVDQRRVAIAQGAGS
ncbi:hypothetical protein SDC9_152167 [bioreactor metagenome]|uniref:Uncharacterized protein n=1 Tax=bioreactor metagenome TaxID=1076179 RepID=A0A645EUP4_9ZZZZ